MKVGICCAGFGPCATGDFIRRSAQASERAGFSAFWLPDHIVLFETYPDSKYPYTADGELPLPSPTLDFAEALMGICWAAAATTKIEVGTSVLILPQRNPLELAKQLSTLDHFSRGRVVLGAGVGWAKEEFDAVGAAWNKRGKAADEYIDAMRALWRGGSSTYSGDLVAFKDAYMFPKPARDIPILIGGESEAAIKRVAKRGDGWFAYLGLPIAEAEERIQHLKALTRAEGRDPERLRLLAPLTETSSMDDMKRWRHAGITEFYLGIAVQMGMDDATLDAHIGDLGHRFVDAVASW